MRMKGAIYLTAAEKKQLMATACKVRMGVIEGTHAAKAGHPGGSLSAADLFTYLYFKEMNVDPKNPKWEDRDRFVLSKGHTAPGLYAALALRGFFPESDLLTLRHIGSHLQGHRLSGPGCLRCRRHGSGRQVPGQGLPGIHPAG